jgi:hypothetical protein
MSVSFFSYFNPTNEHLPGIEDFKKLGVGCQILTITLSILAAAMTFPIGGLGGLATFRYLTGRFKPMDLSESGDHSPAAETARKTSQVSVSGFQVSDSPKGSPSPSLALLSSSSNIEDEPVNLAPAVPIEEIKPPADRFYQPHRLLNGALLGDGITELNFILVDKENGGKELVPVVGFCYGKEFQAYKGSSLEALVKIAQSHAASPMYDSKRPPQPIRYILDHPNNTISEQEFLDFVLAKDERGTPRIYTFHPTSTREVLQMIIEKKMPMNFHETTPQGETLFTRWAKERRDTNVTALLLEIDPTLIKQVQGLSESPFVKAVLHKSQAKAEMLLKAMEQQGVPLSLEEQWMKRAMENDHHFSDAEFQTLSQDLKEKIYCTANSYGHAELLKRLHALGMQEAPLFVYGGHEMIAKNMDLMAAHQVIEGFLQDLKGHDALMTEEDFQKLDRSKYREKGDAIGRIQGTRFIDKVVKENGLKRIKSPKKIAVIKHGVTSLSFNVESQWGEIKVPSGTDQLTIYAQNIKSVNRKLTLEEAIEFMITLEKTGFNDFASGLFSGLTPNFIIAEDGIYFIDTEFSNFEPLSPNFEMINEIKNYLDPQDVDQFMIEYRKRRQKYEQGLAVRQAQEDAYDQAFQNSSKDLRKAYSQHLFTFPVAST